jgi:sugar phosphate isomerase/epimerase
MPIVLTMHSIYDENKDVSINKTVDYISNLLNNIDNEKIIISLENLNDIRGYIRLNKEEIKSTILNDEKIFFTYDIGHEITNYGLITNLDEYMISDIRNVHIHSFDNKGVDHMPIYKNDIHWNEIIKGILFLKSNDYKYNIVFEYGLEYCKGNNVEEKVIDYLNSIDYVSERI